MDSAVSKALAALKANPPSIYTPAPWWVKNPVCERVYASNHTFAADCSTDEDAAHIAAAVNAAPVLAAEVERLQGEVEAERQAGITLGSALFEKLDFLQGQLAAYRLAVEALPELHPERCANGHQCHCGAVKANKARTEARRAVGLEGSHG